MDFYDYLMRKAKNDSIEKVVVGGVISKDKEFLMLRRNSDDFMGGICELPSGNMESGENIREALIREVKEETNLDVADILSYINYFDYVSGSGKKARQYNFYIEVADGNIKLSEHDLYSWMSIDKVRSNKTITDEVKTVLEIVNFNIK